MGGKAREVGEPITRDFSDASGTAGLNRSGYVLQISAAAAPVVTASASGASVYAVAYTDTMDPLYDGVNFTVQYLVNPEIACVREGVVEVQVVALAHRTTNIHVGDLIAVSPATAGTCAHWEDNVAQGVANATFNLANWMAARSEIVGVSEEYLAAASDPADGSHAILVRLMIFGDEG